MGTFILDPTAYRDQCAKLAGWPNELRQAHGVILDFLDIAGVRFAQQAQGAVPPGRAGQPFVRPLRRGVRAGMAALDLPARREPTIVLESGRALIDDAGYMISTVIANKRMPDGSAASWWTRRQHPVHLVLVRPRRGARAAVRGLSEPTSCTARCA